MNEKPERVNWVMQMHDCMIARVLDILYEQVRIDVRERKKLPHLDDGVSFEIDDMRADRKMFVVKKISVGEGVDDATPIDTVKFRCARDDRTDYIVAAKNGAELKITRRWNPETTSCEYFADGKRAEPWQISNKALETLFFS